MPARQCVRPAGRIGDVFRVVVQEFNGAFELNDVTAVLGSLDIVFGEVDR